MGQAGEDLGHGAVDEIAVRHAGGVAGAAGIVQQLGATQHVAAEGGPLALVLDRDDDIAAVGAGEGAVGGDARVLQAHALGRLATVARLQVGHAHQLGCGAEQRDADARAAAGARALHQRLLDADQRVEPGVDVAQRHADAPERFRARTRGAADGHEAAFGLHQQVVGLQAQQRALVAVAADVAGDQARMALTQGLRADAHALGGAGGEVLDEDVGTCQQALQQRQVVGALEVQRDRLLATVDPHPVGGLPVHGAVVTAREVAFRALDLDHARPSVGQAAAAVGRGHGLLQRHHQHAGQRAGLGRLRASGTLAGHHGLSGLVGRWHRSMDSWRVWRRAVPVAPGRMDTIVETPSAAGHCRFANPGFHPDEDAPCDFGNAA